MRIKIKGISVDTSTLVRFEWKFPFPKIYVHERFEHIAKWTIRLLTLVGIVISLLSLPKYYDFGVSLFLLGMEQLIERIVFEYSVMIIQPLPNFKVDENQWLSNGYLFPNEAYKSEYNLLNHFGPLYKDKLYAKMFFEYLQSWNKGSNDDIENNICLSFVIENDNSYSIYLYANPNRKWLDDMFNAYREDIKYEKYGKSQQSMVMQMVYWKTLRNQKGTLFYAFIESQNKRDKFFFCPFFLENDKLVPIEDCKIMKYRYEIKYRKDVSERDIEYYYGPTIKIDPNNKIPIPSNPQSKINELFEHDMVTLLEKASRIQFILADDYEKSPPIICVVFNKHKDGFDAYSRILDRFSNNGSSALIRQEGKHLSLKLIEGVVFSIECKGLDYQSANYTDFVTSNQSNGRIVLLFGFYSNSEDLIFISTQENFNPLVLNKCTFK